MEGSAVYTPMTVTIPDTAINELRGFPVGRECVVQQVFNWHGYQIFQVFDPDTRKTYYLPESMIHRQPVKMAS